MESRSQTNGKVKYIKNGMFLSEYESHESELERKRRGNLPTATTMKKLKQLWNRLRYLTDDEFQQSNDVRRTRMITDSSNKEEVEGSVKAYQEVDQQKSSRIIEQKQYHKPIHKRVISSSDEQGKNPRKIKNTKQQKNNISFKEACSLKQEMKDIMDISGQIEEQEHQ